MARRRKVEDEPRGAPEWIVTFSDMISLLVTFFVMLMSFSTITERETMLIVEAFSNSRGGVVLNPMGPDAVEPPPIDRLSGIHSVRGARQPHARPDEELLQTLEQMGQLPDDEHVALDLEAAHDGLRIAFGEEAAFAPGSAAPTPELERSLGELARVLESYAFLVVVEGHTDDAFQPTPRHPTPQALGAARAAAAARVMLASSALPPEALQVAGLGDERPRVDAGSAAARKLNRRVELRVLGLSKARAERIEREREALLLERRLEQDR
jgi:chemotaxis protein MotB